MDTDKVVTPNFCTTNIQTQKSDISEKRNAGAFWMLLVWQKTPNNGDDGPSVVVVVDNDNGVVIALRVSKHTSDEDIVESLDK